jgi:hypothetical protein
MAAARKIAPAPPKVAAASVAGDWFTASGTAAPIDDRQDVQKIVTKIFNDGPTGTSDLALRMSGATHVGHYACLGRYAWLAQRKCAAIA